MERDYFDSGLDAFSDYEMDELSYITRLISVIDRKNFLCCCTIDVKQFLYKK